ncbi:MAG: hypothetical protein A2X56_14520 [Nitrospirae bacterium GWC2_57_13]|jgi:hypothetical protein|nr:MAG: hypothetical protein A2072_04765 [Nitrospirae bacterium GWC1_57_7]OGW27528.1 MAG: hypothetical protein A2X56_14520 [Nitrospirae bacterium GWC2_57_13]OGW42684.1 MAG: hypothetical protein A2X57_08645 [Nitrospirae bacterium GWD2_57_8]HAR45849.1 hypothetical protein [Nitrospiraceae bacterium]HAS53842.1 hypothetical protein [Nitrospiraceae bacterium]
MRITASIMVITVAGLFLAAPSFEAETQKTAQADESLRRGESQPTLDPATFGDLRVQQAYEAAKAVPWVLDSIYCFCQCEDFFNHKSLLSCYVDDHAAG